MKKIGIMGGTFDPIHIGHLILGEEAFVEFQLDEIWFMPAGNPPHKQKRTGGASDKERVEMVKKAISSNPHFSLCLEEMNTEGITYTYRILENLSYKYPEYQFYFIIGSDSLKDFPKWRNPLRICQLCTLLVANRPSSDNHYLEEKIAEIKEKFQANIYKLNSPNMELSSHDLRKRVQASQSIRYYVTDQVHQYIHQNHIYDKIGENHLDL